MQNHISFWLNWNADTLINRINSSQKRPLAFKVSKNHLFNIIKKRSIVYSKAMYKIECENFSKNEIAEKIIRIYEKFKLSINTNLERYPIIVGSNIIKNMPMYLKKNSIKFNKCLLIIDKNVPKNMILKIVKSFKKQKIFKLIFNASEKNKSLNNVNKILQVLLDNNFSRLDCIITIGGGITGDVGGFAASLYKRGLKFINIPTTLLSQVDSSIGGKTGVNTKHGKNLIGSFYQPKLVISDMNF